ncbi:MAG TPA: type I restriction enzyme HsdR N-terminal domain-containing protein [Bacteroidales bacterium]|nr:type I restriction enzyme HsdR N-terminal domain-containing protein [Bacteroidales bacterium]
MPSLRVPEHPKGQIIMQSPYPPLNLPDAALSLRESNGRTEVYDFIRHRYIILTPEEWVRQHVSAYLLSQKSVPANLIAIEKKLEVNKLVKRFDLVVFDRNIRPLLLAECKAPGVKISESVFDQAARYNLTIKAPLFLVTNGLEHYCCRIDFENRLYVFLNEIPPFDGMLQIADEMS